jgi:molecular chaperone DnaK (HSP70)
VRDALLPDAQTRPLLTLPPTDRQIPTILSYVDGEEYYGQQAKNFLVRNPQNTVAYFRDFVGKEYDAPHPN